MKRRYIREEFKEELKRVHKGLEDLNDVVQVDMK